MLSSDCHSNHSWVSFSGFSTAYNEVFEQLNTSDEGMKILLNAQLSPFSTWRICSRDAKRKQESSNVIG